MRTYEDLHPYQRQAIDFAHYSGRAGLFLLPGLGKTAIGLYLIARNRDHSWLIVCPLRVMAVWEEELTKWADLCHLRVCKLYGPKRGELLAGPKHDVYLINYESLGWLHRALSPSKGQLAPFHHLILDESQRIKDPSTNRWKTLKAMLPIFINRVLLTGTPLGGGGLKGLWSQQFVLDGGRSLGKNFTTFERKHFRKVSDYKWEPWPGTEEYLWGVLDPYCMSMRSVDLLDMPPLTRNIIQVDLPAKARALYDELEQKLFLQLESGETILPPTAAATLTKLRQITQGGVYDDEKDEKGRPLGNWHRLHTAKLEALDGLVDELQGNPLIVLYQYRGELEVLRGRYPDAPVIAGGVGIEESERIRREWNEGRHPVLLAHPRPIGTGLNYQSGGHNICWLANTWSLDDQIQAEARLWRQGQDRGVIVHHIIARNTVDLVVARALASKEATHNDLITALLSYRKERI